MSARVHAVRSNARERGRAVVGGWAEATRRRGRSTTRTAASAAEVATGFQFSPVTHDALREALRRAVRTFAEPKVWAQMQNQGMKADVSWERSAQRYAYLYAELLNAKSEK